MIELENLELLKNRKNLLAFSAGVDSSALLFLLLEKNISFDIALVNYGVRKQSSHEEAYALELAKKHNFKAHIAYAPTFKSNFEKNARDFRYTFFDELMPNYDNLLTAHQLNDQLEWFLMRLTKGAGVTELLGLESISRRKEYTIVRPLLNYTKEQLHTYLEEKQHHFFIDQSNYSKKYERNYFREQFSNRLLKEYQDGIRRSFLYLKEDKESLTKGVKELFKEKEFYILSFQEAHQAIRLVDIYLKKLGYLLSSSQREELKKETSIVFGGIWAVEIVNSIIFIAPYTKTTMSKTFKEVCRVRKIPPKVRAYLFENGIEPKTLPIPS